MYSKLLHVYTCIYMYMYICTCTCAWADLDGRGGLEEAGVVVDEAGELGLVQQEHQQEEALHDELGQRGLIAWGKGGGDSGRGTLSEMESYIVTTSD